MQMFHRQWPYNRWVIMKLVMNPCNRQRCLQNMASCSRHLHWMLELKAVR